MCERCFREAGAAGRGQVPHPHRMHREELHLEVDVSAIEEAVGISQTIQACFLVYRDRPCLGRQQGNEVQPAADDASEFQWTSYKQVQLRCRALAWSLRQTCHLIPGRDVICLFADVSEAWFVAHYSCLLHGYLVVPVAKETRAEVLASILERSRASGIITSRGLRGVLSRSLLYATWSRGKQPLIICIDGADGPPSMLHQRGLGETRNPVVRSVEETFAADVSFGQLLVEGAKELLVVGSNRLPLPVPRDDRPVVLLPTSGSSGNPKLCIVTDGMLRARCHVPRFGALMVVAARRPLHQSVDVLCNGGRIGICPGDVTRLSAQLRLLRPTAFGEVPAVWQQLHRRFLSEVRRESERESESGRAAASHGAGARDRVLQRWRQKQMLGNRCRIAIVGGAAASAELKRWMWDVFECQVVDGYGATEVGAVSDSGGVLPGQGQSTAFCTP